MKKITLGLLMLITTISNAQTFKFNNDLSSDYVVYTTPDIKANELYNKTISWVNETFTNGDKVIISKVENEMIRLNGQSRFREKIVGRLSSANVINYQIEIQFQDGKYRMKYIQNKFWIDAAGQIIMITDTEKILKYYRTDYEKLIQDIMDSSFNYITKPKEKW